MLKEYTRRIAVLVVGTLVSSIGIVLMLRANIGLEPWSALQRGLEISFGFSFGFASMVVGVAAIVLGVLMGESFGLGTVSNILLCAVFIDGLIALDLIPEMRTLVSGTVMLLAGMIILALGTWLYMSAGLGSGPRDALMVGLARKTHKSVGLCRSSIELLCILTGFLMGAKIGVGTVIAAVGIGALINATFRLFRFDAAKTSHETVVDTLNRIRGKQLSP